MTKKKDKGFKAPTRFKRPKWMLAKRKPRSQQQRRYKREHKKMVYDPVTGEGRLVRTRPRRATGQTIHVTDHPKPPGPWIDTFMCYYCGRTYEKHNSGVTWGMGSARARELNRQNDAGGAHLSRGVVLWAMRAYKLEDWYGLHLEAHGWSPQWGLDHGWDPDMDEEGPLFDAWYAKAYPKGDADEIAEEQADSAWSKADDSDLPF